MKQVEEIVSFAKAKIQKEGQVTLNFKIIDIKEIKNSVMIKLSVQANGQAFPVFYDVIKEEAYKTDPIGRCIGDIAQKLNEERGKKYKYVIGKNSMTISKFLEVV